MLWNLILTAALLGKWHSTYVLDHEVVTQRAQCLQLESSGTGVWFPICHHYHMLLLLSHYYKIRLYIFFALSMKVIELKYLNVRLYNSTSLISLVERGQKNSPTYYTSF